MGRTVILLLATLLANTTALGKTWTIRPDGTGDAPTIKAGVDSASAGDTVLVTCGTYFERNITLKSGICLSSETGAADCATIDGQHQGVQILYLSGVDSTTSIVGFTICGGDGSYWPPGGGMYCYQSHPRVKNCRIVSNGCLDCYGGGVYMLSSSPVFTSCVFASNSIAAAFYGGGGVYAERGSPRFEDCIFSNNNASSAYGGGFACQSACSPTFEGCLFAGNKSDLGGGGIAVGPIAGTPPAFATISDCTFYGNSVTELEGAGVWTSGSCSASLDNVIIAFSTLGTAIGRQTANPPYPLLTCCDLYGNAGGDWHYPVADQYGIRGNICADPLFCDASGRDFSLTVGSPCLDTDSCGTYGAYGAGCDPAASAEGSPDGSTEGGRGGLKVAAAPNPVTGGTRIDFELPVAGRVSAIVFSVTGEQTRVLADRHFAEGPQSLAWDCCGSDGAPVPPGVYFCRVTSGCGSVMLKTVVAR